MKQPNKETNNVDGKEVPIPHFGIVLEWSQFEEFEEQLRTAKIKFPIFARNGQQLAYRFYVDQGLNEQEAINAYVFIWLKII